MAGAAEWGSGCHEDAAHYEEIRLLQRRRRLSPAKGGGAAAVVIV